MYKTFWRLPDPKFRVPARQRRQACVFRCEACADYSPSALGTIEAVRRLTQLFSALVVSLAAFAANSGLTPEQRAVAEHISADSLRGHLSFISSDSLEGRATPSRGLDLA